MSFDRAQIRDEVAAHGPAMRVVIVRSGGSVPREAGTSMLVWPDRISGTIGGGALEHAAIRLARSGRSGISRHALGPELGQCCGGAVTLHVRRWDLAELDALAPEAGLLFEGPGPRPAGVAALVARAAAGIEIPIQIRDGWLVEPLAAAPCPVWIWGAGHVGRALVSVLAPLPGLALTWIDTAPERFPDLVPDRVDRLVAADPPRLVARAPAGAHHLIVTYSHEIDLALCHALLGQPTASIGLIGSATKWARFRSRLTALGHADARISGIRCPIGDPELGKHPQAIAVGVAADLLRSGAPVAERIVG